MTAHYTCDHRHICPDRKAAEVKGEFWQAGDGTYVWLGKGRIGTVRQCPWCYRDLDTSPPPILQGDGYDGEDGG